MVFKFETCKNNTFKFENLFSLISSYFQNFKTNMCLKNALYSFKIYFLNVLVENIELEQTSHQNLFFYIKARFTMSNC